MWCRRKPAAFRAASCAFAAVLLLAAAAALSGCGFHPLYGQASPGSAQNLSRIEIASIKDRAGQKLRNLLFDRFSPRGAPAQPLYTLHVELSETVAQLAVRSDNSATRANLTVTAHFWLTPPDAPDKVLHTASVTSVNSYDRLRTQYATLVAENDARDRALRQIADQIQMRVAAVLGNPAALRLHAQAAPDRKKAANPLDWR